MQSRNRLLSQSGTYIIESVLIISFCSLAAFAISPSLNAIAMKFQWAAVKLSEGGGTDGVIANQAPSGPSVCYQGFCSSNPALILIIEECRNRGGTLKNLSGNGLPYCN
jgi:hypothetical protein